MVGQHDRNGVAPSMAISIVIGVDPKQTTLLQLGIVSGRVALLLRSTEIHPVLLRFVAIYSFIFKGVCVTPVFASLDAHVHIFK